MSDAGRASTLVGDIVLPPVPEAVTEYRLGIPEMAFSDLRAMLKPIRWCEPLDNQRPVT
jgi:hypothetical protein